MAFYQKEYTDADLTEQNSSKFNEAFLKMHRIHKMQDLINLSSMNPLAFNEILGIRNYEAIISACNSLLEECWGKMSDEEKINATNLREAIRNFLRENKIIENSIDTTSFNRNKKEKLNQKNYYVLEDWIFKYKQLARELLSRTGYDSPNKEEWDEDEL